MKTKVILLAVLSLGFIFTSCQKDDLNVVPSSKITTTNFSATGITELDVSDIFKVYVTFSETEESVQVEANENLHQAIEMSQSGNKLIVGLQKNTNISGTPVLNVYIKTSALNKLSAIGASTILFQNKLVSNKLVINLEGAALLNGEVEVNELISDLLGASEMTVSGSADLLEVKAEGASKMRDFNFNTDNLDAYLYGASEVSVTVNQKLDVTASGASNVYYKGSGVVENQNLSDSSKITKMD
jgi:hypothetical protein